MKFISLSARPLLGHRNLATTLNSSFIGNRICSSTVFDRESKNDDLLSEVRPWDGRIGRFFELMPLL